MGIIVFALFGISLISINIASGKRNSEYILRLFDKIV
jgi:hypothetical protein